MMKEERDWMEDEEIEALQEEIRVGLGSLIGKMAILQ